MNRNYLVYVMDTEIFEDDGVFDRCMERVSAYRRDKVMRLRFRHGRNASLAAGVLLAYVLDEYAGVDERDCAYVMGDRGKPRIVCGTDVHFSLSHTDNLVGVMVGCAPCGIDVERIRSFPESIVKRIFSDDDRAVYMSFDDERERDLYCAKVWTRREAYGKMTGDGVLMNDEAQQRVMDEDYMADRGVLVRNIAVPSGAYMTAVCTGDGGKCPAAVFADSGELVLSMLKW